jgi:cysteine desulfurase/selenocysteine lyase
MSLDPEALRADFPVLQRDWGHRPPLVYLDSACMSLRPRQVIDAVTEYYELHSACAGRSVHTLANEVSLRVNRTRMAFSRFIGASRADEVVFTLNTTAAINMLASGLGLWKGDAIVVSDREHNSNLVPWLALGEARGVKVRKVSTGADGTLDIEGLHDALAPGDTKVVAMTHTSNLDGTTLPLREVAEISHDKGARVVADGAQSAPHVRLDVAELEVDYLALSAHKMLGPSGVGVLWGRHELLKDLKPKGGGGGAVAPSEPGKFERLPPPDGLEPGLQNLAGIYGAEAAVEYLTRVGLENVHAHDLALNRRATEAISDIDGLTILGPADPSLRGNILTFVVEGVNHHELGMALDELGNVAVRTGMHCNHSWFQSHGGDGAVRVSFYLYNTTEDVDRFVAALSEALTILR